MSILLDALKKSEAQRQLGETPTIHSPVGAPQPSTVEVKPWLVGLMLLSVAVLLALYVIKQFDEPDLSILGYSEMDLSLAPPVSTETDRAEENQPRTAEADRTPVESFEQEGAENRPGGLEQQSKARLRQSVSDYTPPAATEPAEAQPDLSASAPVSQRSRSVPEPEDTPVLTYWQLPQAVRDNIPDLKIAVLVYAANPDDRFILMGGNRLREGEDAGGGLRLDEIQRNGAIFSYRKYTFIVTN